jgi:hypothetical protein
MLACMHPDVDFHPLRLPGLRGSYEGHQGASEWFAGLVEMEHHHRVELAQISAVGSQRVIAAGTLSGDHTGGASFWALTRLELDLIVSSRHHLSDRFHLR